MERISEPDRRNIGFCFACPSGPDTPGATDIRKISSGLATQSVTPLDGGYTMHSSNHSVRVLRTEAKSRAPAMFVGRILASLFPCGQDARIANIQSLELFQAEAEWEM